MNTTIRQRENGKYQAIVSYKDKKGKWKQKSRGGFEKHKDAKLWANEKTFELTKLDKKGILDNNYTLSEAYELFMEYKSSTTSDNTKEAYYRAMLFFNDFKNIPVSKIKSVDLLEFIKKKRLENNCLYNSYIQKLRSIFSFAVKQLRACEYNPCDILYRDNTDTDERIKFIDNEFYKEILKHFKKYKYKLLIRLLYETGMRVSEAYGLSVVNVKECLIEVKQQRLVSTGKITTKLKTKNSYRTIPISPVLYNDLIKSDCDINGLIFYDIKYPGLRRKLAQLNTSSHCFRHTRATILVSSGIDLTVVSNIVGDNINTILNAYVEVNRNELSDKYEQVRKLI